MAAPAVSVDAYVVKAFQEYDADGNGTMDATELEAALTGLGMPCDPTAVASLIASFSMTGTLTLEQFDGVVKMLQLARKMELSKKPLTPEALEAFKRFDTDGSGDISCAELHVLLRELKLDIDLDYTRRLLGVYKNWHASDMPELKDHKSGGVSLETALSLEEFTPLYHDLVAGTPPVPRPKVDPEILTIFREHDADCNGEIDLTELGALLESISLPMDPTALAAVIHNFSQGTSALNASQLEGVVRFARLAARQMNLPVHSGGGAAAEESASTASTGDAPPPNGSQTPSSPSAALKGTVSSVHWSATA